MTCRLLATPIFPRRLSSLISKFSHKKINCRSGVTPLEGVARGGAPPTPSYATANNKVKTFLVSLLQTTIITHTISAIPVHVLVNTAAKYYNFIRMSPLTFWMVSPGAAPRPSTSDATGGA